MKKEQPKAGRRKFLTGSAKTIVATSLTLAIPVPSVEEKVFEEGAEPLPGDPGYRDPGTYGSLAD